MKNKMLEFTLTLVVRPDGHYATSASQEIVMGIPVGTAGQTAAALHGAVPPLAARLINELVTTEALADLLAEHEEQLAKAAERHAAYMAKVEAEKAAKAQEENQ